MHLVVQDFFHQPYVFIHGGFSSQSCYLSGGAFLNDLYLESHPTLEIGFFRCYLRRDGDLLVVSQTNISPQVKKSYSKMRSGNATKSTKLHAGKRIPFKTCVQIRRQMIFGQALAQKQRKKKCIIISIQIAPKKLGQKKPMELPSLNLSSKLVGITTHPNPYALP